MRSLAALLVVAAFAGCGGATTRQPPPERPHLPRTLAQGWARRADAVAAALAAGDDCLAKQRAAALQSAVIDAIDTHRVGARFDEPLQSAVNDLVGRITCTPPAPVTSPSPPEHRGHGKGHDEGHEKKPHGHGKHKGHDG